MKQPQISHQPWSIRHSAASNNRFGDLDRINDLDRLLSGQNALADSSPSSAVCHHNCSVVLQQRHVVLAPSTYLYFNTAALLSSLAGTAGISSSCPISCNRQTCALYTSVQCKSTAGASQYGFPRHGQHSLLVIYRDPSLQNARCLA